MWETVTIEFMIKLCIIYFFVVWIGLIIWVAKDIGSRSESRIFQLLCVLLMILLTPIWIFVYLLIRPRKSLYEKYYGEIEDNLGILHEIIEERLWEETENQDMVACIHCDAEIRSSWKVCPYCEKKQKKKSKRTKKKK